VAYKLHAQRPSVVNAHLQAHETEVSMR
jgi:hypothetical protein